jgi:hypothetical protein
MGAFFAILGIFLLIPLLVGIGMYVLMAAGLYSMAMNKKIENPWLAWIPIGNLYILGKLIPELKLSTYVIPSHEMVLPAVFVITLFFGRIPLLGALISLVNLILIICAIYTLFKRYVGDKALMYTVIGIVTFGIMMAVFIYMLRNERQIE